MCPLFLSISLSVRNECFITQEMFSKQVSSQEPPTVLLSTQKMHTSTPASTALHQWSWDCHRMLECFLVILSRHFNYSGSDSFIFHQFRVSCYILCREVQSVQTQHILHIIYSCSPLPVGFTSFRIGENTFKIGIYI